MTVSVILPSYNPSEKLVETVHELLRSGFDDIIVINDGSNEKSLEHFEAVRKLEGVTVLSHEVNKGKGKALKTGFTYFLENRKESSGVVTTDDDGQHMPTDILKCAEKMEQTNEAVFGARNFSKENVPSKSRFGNNVTRFVFNFLCGIKITDTQTGLRAIPRDYLPTLIQTSGDKFEYETNTLLKMKQNGLTFSELPIETIYIENNSATHFRPIRDSIKIYSVIIAYLLSSVCASIIDLGLFTLLNLLLPKEFDGAGRIAVSTIGARAVSSIVNFTINRKSVFKSNSGVASSLIKYYALCVCQMGLSYLLVYLLSTVTGTQQSFVQTLFKMAVDVILFILCFIIQREWVFKNKKGGGKNA